MAHGTHANEGFPVEDAHDAYRERAKLPDRTTCPDCHAVFEGGRWQRKDPLPGAVTHLCPACRRIRDHAPAAIVTLGGDFLRGHRDEIMARVRHVCERASQDHPLERLMEIDEDDEVVHLSTTSVQLACRIGRALQAAWDGELDLDAGGEGTPRIVWRR
jgi:NMD protein affecting ribosome stability and mRNA decay